MCVRQVHQVVTICQLDCGLRGPKTPPPQIIHPTPLGAFPGLQCVAPTCCPCVCVYVWCAHGRLCARRCQTRWLVRILEHILRSIDDAAAAAAAHSIINSSDIDIRAYLWSSHFPRNVRSLSFSHGHCTGRLSSAGEMKSNANNMRFEWHGK